MDRERAERFPARMIRLLADIVEIFESDPADLADIERFYDDFIKFNPIPYSIMADGWCSSPHRYCAVCKNHF